MLQIFSIPLNLVKLVFSALVFAIHACLRVAQLLERVATELERESARTLARSRLERDADRGADENPHSDAARAERLKKLAVLNPGKSSLGAPSSRRARTPIPLPPLSPPRPPDNAARSKVSEPQKFSRPSSRSSHQTSNVQASRTASAIGSPVDSAANSISLVLFDLDGTLLDTNDLEQFRGREHLGPQGDEYIARLSAAYHRSRARHVYHPKHLAELAREFPTLRFGVFTRSPRTYADVLLNLGFNGWKWDVVIACEDVARSKPYGDGVTLAMREMGLDDLQRVALVGDNMVDVQAAYSAGCLSFLETSSKLRPVLRALEKIPDGLLRGPATLAQAIRAPATCLPALEQLLLDPTDLSSLRFDVVPHSGDGTYNLEIFVMGRLFTDSPDLLNRARWHGLTKSILANKSADKFPAAWTLALGAFLREQLKRRRELLVTVVPARRGRTPRMERLLRQLANEVAAEVGERCIFVPNVMEYAPGARSHSGEHLTRHDRMANVRENLAVARKDVVATRDVVVIDDVVTSGATLMGARRRLLESGARDVICVALAKAVRFS